MSKYLFFSVLILIFSCTTAIQSNKASDFNTQIKSFLIIIQMSEATEKFQTKFQSALEKSFQSRNIKTKIENLQLKTTIDTYKGLYESLSDKSKSEELRFGKL